MALTKSQVSELYVSIFNRASEGTGNTYWQSTADLATAATAMLNTADAKTYFGTSLDTDQAFIEHIYLNTLNKTYAQDTAGVDYWVGQLATSTRGEVVASLVNAVATYATSTDATTKAAYDQFTNRVAVSDNMADTVSAAPTDYATSTSFVTSSNPTGGLTVSNDAATVTTANTAVSVIADATVVPTYTITSSAASVTEGSSVTFTVTASAAFASKATVLNYQLAGVSVAGGTASPAADLGKVTGEVTIAAGATTGTITITPTDDGVTEGFEGFNVTLLDASFATAATSGNVVIKDGATAGTTQALATTIDSKAGTSGDDTFNSAIVANNTTGSTLQAGDTITAGAGIDTLSVSISGSSGQSVTTQAFQATDLEKVLVSNYDTHATDTFDNTVDLALVTGVTTVGLSSSGALGDTIFSGLNSIVNAEMRNGAGDLTVTYGASATAGTADAQNLAISNVSAGTFAAAGIETLNITTSIAASTLTGITANQITKLVVAGDKNLTVTGALATATIDASALTGALNITGATATQTITGGTGNDIIDMTTVLTAADTINGGAGTDTLKISTAGTIDATATTGEISKVSNVENIQINSTNDAATLSLTGVTGVSTVEAAANVKTYQITTVVNSTAIVFTLNGTEYTTAATDASATATEAAVLVAGVINALSGFTATSTTDTVTITAVSGEAIEIGTPTGGATAVTTSAYSDVSFTGLAGTETIDIYSADKVTTALTDASGLTDVANINLKTVSADKGFNHTVGEVVVVETETVNLSSTGFTDTFGNTLTTLTADAKLTTLNITGESNLTIGTTTASKLATINASTATGDVSIDGAITTDVAQTITTGAGNDTIDMGAATFVNASDTIDGGSNTALANGTAGTDTLNGNATGLNATTGVLKIANVENINLTNTGSAVINAAGITGASQLAFTGAGATTTVSGLAAASTIGLGFTDQSGAAVTGTTTLTLADETGTADAVTVNLNEVTSNTLKATAIETVNLAFSTTAAISEATSTLTVSALNAKTINVTGANADTTTILALGTLDTDTTTVDASGYKGVLTMTAGTGTAMTVSANGAVANTITTSTGADTVTLAGNLGTTTNDITAGTGADVLNATANNAATDFSAVDGFETINLTVAASTATGFGAADAGLNEATTVNILGGNSLSSFAASAIDVNTAATTIDASGFNGAVNLTFANGGLNAFTTLIGSSVTTDTARTTVSTTLTGAKVASMTGIETLVVTSTNAETASSAIDLTNATGLVTVDATFANAAAADIITVSKLAAGVNVKVNATETGDNLVVGLASATGATDSLNVEITTATAANDVLNLDVAGLETLTITNKAAAAVTVDLAGVSATTGSTTTVNVTGAIATTLTALHTSINVIDASTATGALTVAATSRDTDVYTITGGAANDTIAMENKADVLDGGAGTGDNLIINYAAILGGTEIDLSATDAVVSMDGSTNSVAQTNFESIDLSGYTGFGAVIVGSASANTIVGTGSTDNITGGEGIDTITGGAGADAIVLTESTSVVDNVILNYTLDSTTNFDTITGFVSGTDKIQFSAAAIDGAITGTPLASLITANVDTIAGTELGTNAATSVKIVANAAALASGSIGAATDQQTIIYITDVAEVYINDDAATGGGLTKVADLGSAVTLVESDFMFIA